MISLFWNILKKNNKNLHMFNYLFSDESGSDSEGADSTSSSYSSLSDFVSEMVSSDLSPSKYSICNQVLFLL